MPVLHSFLIEVARLGLWLTVLAVIFVPLERFFALQQIMGRRGDRLLDLACYFINSLVPAALIAWPMALVAALAHRALPAWWAASVAHLPGGLRLALVFVIGEIGFYWGHRWSHEWAWMWRFHRVHHRPERLDWLINTRAHPVDMVFTRVCGLVPIYLAGLVQPDARGGITAVAILLLGTIWGFFIHANIRCPLGPLEQAVASPRFHHWHHVRVGPIGSNYAAMLPLLDRLFGTLHLPRRGWPDAYGIDEST